MKRELIGKTIFLTLVILTAKYQRGSRPLGPLIVISGPTGRSMRVFNRCIKHVQTTQFIRVRTHIRNCLRGVLFIRKGRIGRGRPLFVVGSTLCGTGMRGTGTRLGGGRTRTTGTGHSMRHLRPLCRRRTTDRLSLSGTLTSLKSTRTSVTVDGTSLSRTRLRLDCAAMASPLTKCVDRHFISINTLINPNMGSGLTTMMGDSAILMSFGVATLSCLHTRHHGVGFKRRSASHS